MEDWNSKIRLDDGELVTSYYSTIFEAKIPIRFIGTSDKVHLKQEQNLKR